MNRTENDMIRYQIQLERYKNGQADEIIALLDRASSDISRFIRQTDGVYTKARYKEIASKLSEISKSLKEKVAKNTDIDGIIDYELKKTKKLLNAIKGDIVKAKGGKVNFIYPSREQIKTSALFKPVTEGFTYDSYLDGIEAGLFNMWDSAVRTGYLTGQTTRDIVENVMGGLSPKTRLTKPGLIQTLRNSIYTNTKTLLQSFASETRNRVFEENEKYFGDGESEYKYEWLSTLDSHTCLVCGDLDGKLFKSIKDAPSIPVHRGCVLGNTLVSSVDGITKVFRRKYKGLIYRITTARGDVLSVTPNHPILTDRGFVRAHLLNIGDNVICNNGLETLNIIGKGENHRKACIKDVFSSFRKSPSMFTCTVPTASEDFHCDTTHKKVDIVCADRVLSNKRDVLGLKDRCKNFFVFRHFGKVLLDKSHKCSIFSFFNRNFATLRNFMGRFGKMCNLLFGRMFHPFDLLFTWIPLSDAMLLKEAYHSSPAVSETFSDTCNTDSLIVKFKNFINRKVVGWILSRSADISVMQDVSDNVFGRTELAGNILDGYSAQIQSNRIIAIDVKFSFTHVYNLETKNSWYVANGIITHNCRCVLLPFFNIEGDTRASKDGYVDSKVKFSDWLEGQDEKTQKDVLGASRFKLFKEGVKISQFVDNGEVLTLDELFEDLEKSTPVELSEETERISMSSKDFKELKTKFLENDITLDDELQNSDKEGLSRLLTYVENSDYNGSVKRIAFNKPDEKGGMNMHFDGELTLSKKSFSDIKGFEKRIKIFAEHRVIPKNSTLESLFEHEIKGHGSERLLILKKYGFAKNGATFNKGQIAWNANEMSENVCNEAWEKVKDVYAKNGISRLQAERRISLTTPNAGEVLAEAVADVYANKNNAELFSRAITDILLEKLGER